MIGYLRGKVLVKKVGEMWVDVQGVGYRVKCQMTNDKYQIGVEIALYIHTVVRQDALELYGFLTMEQLSMFELLLNVSGVGPKTALAIVGSRSVEQIYKAVQEADVVFFQRVPGIGKKGAQRIIVDLKGKIPSLKELDLADEGDSGNEVVSALTQFGFNRNDVVKVLGKLEPGLTEEQQIREGLKRLGRK